MSFVNREEVREYLTELIKRENLVVTLFNKKKSDIKRIVERLVNMIHYKRILLTGIEMLEDGTYLIYFKKPHYTLFIAIGDNLIYPEFNINMVYTLSDQTPIQAITIQRLINNPEVDLDAD